MTPFHQVLIIVLSGIVGFMIIVGIVAMIKPSSQMTNSSLPAGVIEQSKKYVEKLGVKPFDHLKTNQKLILIHSYYNLENYKAVIQHAETMIDELRSLTPERKIAFADMIENSYLQLGQDNVVMEFREAVGL
ncbi:MAG: hypothetical protein ETSY1_30495 [Candidatus Entotheonella factor]|uniref:Uncharacterized protein n=1 Tax=Entotheonella factor TaxID=1429438 RepID=W4LBV9_ENTF1|nr:MAG: hypothetical protein ETSY1_30495 [Candidatus Entotheonella factor]